MMFMVVWEPKSRTQKNISLRPLTKLKNELTEIGMFVKLEQIVEEILRKKYEQVNIVHLDGI